ncbi:TSUP family transporter [Microcoleus sp. FACHB-1515]|uniref:TSUP family transporter n=1 Tax=Cyanophyceae TaxID=3028117 RepID=UPI00168251AD|nr:TSUP family transporter [Microcoleus sp. FACHB-1515]MBD2089312.1 TSUP family transporter [Microcoleus sp. FACHB-1515]
MDWTFLIGIFAAGMLAGFVDAIAGGGGLILLPAVLLSGLPVGAAVATNKLCGTFGALTSSLRFAQAKQVNLTACLWMGIPAAIGAFLGSQSIGFLPKQWAEPIVILLMIGITIFVLVKPEFGQANSEVKFDRPQQFKLAFWGLAIGFHDGFFGPGTGTFLVFALVSIGSLNFLQGTGTAKVINFITNITALIAFLLMGSVNFAIGLSGAAGSIIGSYLGASVATQRGAKIIKPLFLTVTSVLVGKLIWNYVD